MWLVVGGKKQRHHTANTSGLRNHDSQGWHGIYTAPGYLHPPPLPSTWRVSPQVPLPKESSPRGNTTALGFPPYNDLTKLRKLTLKKADWRHHTQNPELCPRLLSASGAHSSPIKFICYFPKTGSIPHQPIPYEGVYKLPHLMDYRVLTRWGCPPHIINSHPFPGDLSAVSLLPSEGGDGEGQGRSI